MNEDSDPIPFTLTSIPTTGLLNQIMESYKSDLVTMQLYEKVLRGKKGPKYIVRNEGLYYKVRVYVPKDQKIKNHLLELLHSSPLDGHSGYDKNLYRVNQEFY